MILPSMSLAMTLTGTLIDPMFIAGTVIAIDATIPFTASATVKGVPITTFTVADPLPTLFPPPFAASKNVMLKTVLPAGAETGTVHVRPPEPAIQMGDVEETSTSDAGPPLTVSATESAEADTNCARRPWAEAARFGIVSSALPATFAAF